MAIFAAIATFAVASQSLAVQTSDRNAASQTFNDYGDAATATLLRWFHSGWWSLCDYGCGSSNSDWGADMLTATLFFRWKLSSDHVGLSGYFQKLAVQAPRHHRCGSGCNDWSDVPEWDAVAAALDDIVVPQSIALAKAQAAFSSVETSDRYARGACPDIRYQRPLGIGGGLKTLETEANAIRAALLLHRITGSKHYLQASLRQYAAARRRFLDPNVPLYSVYVFDNGKRCAQLPHRFFASVNGLMIGNGLALWKATRDASYRRNAEQTARAVEHYLADGAGIYENLQAENDVAEPLVESMFELAQLGNVHARSWIVHNASTAMWERGPSGAFGRFFGGPSPSGSTAWQTNGGLALAIAAAALEPKATPDPALKWQDGAVIFHRIIHLPARIHFVASGIALRGTIGRVCCEHGHARLFIDGVETFDHSGVWQNKSTIGRPQPDSILFAWRWRTRGAHTITLASARYNPKEGNSFVDIDGYMLRP